MEKDQGMKMPTPLLSMVMRSNLYTMIRASEKDPRQRVPADPWTMPDEETRRLRAMVILEEALETIRGLGMDILIGCGTAVPTVVLERMEQVKIISSGRAPDMEQIVDGCCDVIYVATGTLASCGVPDLPHLMEVCDANFRKMPPSTPIRFNDSGKFLKPEGWVGPNHEAVRQTYAGYNANLAGMLVVSNARK